MGNLEEPKEFENLNREERVKRKKCRGCMGCTRERSKTLRGGHGKKNLVNKRQSAAGRKKKKKNMVNLIEGPKR